MKLLLGLILLGSLVPDFHNTSAFADTSQASRQHDLSQIQRIYIARMGRTDHAARFRLLLQDRLTKKGFTVVDKSADADAILKGAFTVNIHEGSEARVYIVLESLDGERLWARDFDERVFKGLFTLKEPAKLRAQEVASALRDACKPFGRK